MKFVHMVYEFLKIIRSFPQASYEGSARLVEFIKVIYIYQIKFYSFTILLHVSWFWEVELFTKKS